MSSALQKFSPVALVSPSGELTVNAGRYSRASVIAAFEMNGGWEAFADWAQQNKTEFYTKLFGKLIGREAVEEAPSEDDLEGLLDVLDVEAEDITDVEDLGAEPTVEPVSKFRSRLAEKAALYAKGESETD